MQSETSEATQKGEGYLSGCKMANTPRFGPFRRIVTSHEPDKEGSEEPQVAVRIIDTQPDFVEGLNLYSGGIWTTDTCPATNSYDFGEDAGGKSGALIVNPGGSNCRLTELPPGVTTPMHRTSSVDYNIITHGSGVLLTPAEADSSAVNETPIKVGDVIVQRGTLHAWRASEQGMRWTSVILEALPVSFTKDGQKHTLEDTGLSSLD
ncbi:hypothetical protein K437DRAFT_143579 [Tilletiaria anomala UBC 951]|uniref:Uncharacterized protein n=1 Tax=Tilletiaria anomala (strain ATCC 24038 / CBS 436.72 / UBC 951) TaxID=1037660 RepID=A0A066VZJ1_TILAU|nr:uncharacterized protein K437DRAFT_143579 [Tilletiaria anomala UBC 951]KDN43940.1 hypothetical protein K437DRAFT_143579 [Tilletiaria anomala UBC 951]